MAMGTWGPGPFENDMALEVKNRFLELTGVTGGMPAVDAQVRLRTEFELELADAHDGPLVRAALEALPG